MNAIQRALASLALLALLCAGLWWLGFSQGKTSRDKHYQPILTAIEGERRLAQGRLETYQRASKALLADQEKRHAEFEKNLRARADATGERLARLVSDLSRCRSDRVPEMASAAALTRQAAEELERARRIGERVSGIGEGCESDAQQVLDFQRRWEAQRHLLSEEVGDRS